MQKHSLHTYFLSRTTPKQSKYNSSLLLQDVVQTKSRGCSFSTTRRSQQCVHAKAEEPPSPANVVNSISSLNVVA